MPNPRRSRIANPRGTRPLRKRESPAVTVVARTLTSISVALTSGVGTFAIWTTSGGP
jgi:hypothetical protein